MNPTIPIAFDSSHIFKTKQEAEESFMSHSGYLATIEIDQEVEVRK